MNELWSLSINKVINVWLIEWLDDWLKDWINQYICQWNNKQLNAILFKEQTNEFARLKIPSTQKLKNKPTSSYNFIGYYIHHEREWIKQWLYALINR